MQGVAAILSLCFSAEPLGRFGLASQRNGANYILSPFGQRCCPAAAGVAGELCQTHQQHRFQAKARLACQACEKPWTRLWPSQLAPAENPGKSPVSPICRVVRPKGGWRYLPHDGERLRVILNPSLYPSSSPVSTKKPKTTRKKGWRKLLVFFPLVSFTFSVPHPHSSYPGALQPCPFLYCFSMMLQRY